jgi:hypothetical protein
MTAPTITPLPDAPTASDSQAQFDQKAYPFAQALGPMGTQMNELALWMQSQIDAISHIVVEKTASLYDVDNSDHMKYLYFTNTSAKTVNVRSNAAHSLDDNYELNIRNAAAGNLTIVGASGVTITPPAGGTLVVPQNGTVTLKRVGIDAFHLMGQVNAA